MPTFDGENLIITLDPVVDGVLDVDVGIALYTEWKTWAKQGNLRFPAAFRTTGGDELTAIINAGSYFFLRNDFGWRIKSAENDATYYLVGNLAAQDTALPVFVPTTGTFTAAILGLQPVTQGVTPAMGDQLAFNSYQGAVCVDAVGGYVGTGAIGSDEIGTRKAPSSNMTDALFIALREGLNRFNIASNITISATLDFSAGYQFVGDRPQLILTLLAAPNMSDCAITNLTLTGDVDGVNTIRDSSIGLITDISGFIEKVAFYDDIVMAGDLNIYESYSQKAGAGYVVIDTGGNILQVSDWHRSIGITNMTGANNHTIEMYGGQLHLDATCTGGTIYLRGDYSSPPDDQSNGTILIDETNSKELLLARKLLSNRAVIKSDDTETNIYDDDGLTVLHTFTHSDSRNRDPV